MVLAKQWKHPELKSSGLFGSKPLVVYTSAEFHYSITKGANWLGFGLENVIKIPVDDVSGSMIPEELEKAIQETLDDGSKTPLMINATVGSTVRGGFDNLVNTPLLITHKFRDYSFKTIGIIIDLLSLSMIKGCPGEHC